MIVKYFVEGFEHKQGPTIFPQSMGSRADFVWKLLYNMMKEEAIIEI